MSEKQKQNEYTPSNYTSYHVPNEIHPYVDLGGWASTPFLLVNTRQVNLLVPLWYDMARGSNQKPPAVEASALPACHWAFKVERFLYNTYLQIKRAISYFCISDTKFKLYLFRSTGYSSYLGIRQRLENKAA